MFAIPIHAVQMEFVESAMRQVDTIVPVAQATLETHAVQSVQSTLTAPSTKLVSTTSALTPARVCADLTPDALPSRTPQLVIVSLDILATHTENAPKVNDCLNFLSLNIYI